MEVEASWATTDPLCCKAWDAPAPDPDAIPFYEAGTWGPVEAELLLNKDGRRWRQIVVNRQGIYRCDLH